MYYPKGQGAGSQLVNAIRRRPPTVNGGVHLVMSDPKRHHIVQESILRRFAVNDKIIMVPRSGGKKITVSPKNCAVEKQFYTVEKQDGTKSYEIESLLSEMENAAITIIRKIDAGLFPLSNDDRECLALFMAIQSSRGRDTRDLQEEAMTEMTRMIARVVPREYIKATMTKNGQEPNAEEVDQQLSALRQASVTLDVVVHQNQHIKAMMRDTLNLLPYFINRRWTLVQSKSPCLLISDRPIVLVRKPDPERPHLGVGPANAELIFFPLDPHKALALWKTPGTPGITEITAKHAHALNTYTANQAYKWIFHSPEHDPLANLTLRPAGPRVVSGITKARD